MTDTQYDKLIDWLEIRFSAIDDRFHSLRGEMIERFDILRGEMRELHTEMLERFQSVNDRLDVLERRITSLTDSQEIQRDNVFRISADLANVRQDIARLDTRLDHIARDLHGVNLKIAALGDDMRQRFRVLTERVAAV